MLYILGVHATNVSDYYVKSKEFEIIVKITCLVTEEKSS